MNIEGYKVMICDCGDSLSKACGAKNECSVATSLCRSQTDDLAKALLQAKDQNDALLIACTQETAVFESVAEDNSCPAPATLNIRELAGWSDESADATPKIAALIKQAGEQHTPSRGLALESAGRCLIYADAGRPNGGADAALTLGARLNGSLGVTVMLANPHEELLPTNDLSLIHI